MKSVVIPNAFATSKDEFMQRFNKVLPVTDQMQIDIMDGKFVSEKSIEIKDIPDLHVYKKMFEAHLMVAEPAKYVEDLAKKGFSKVIFHYEACKNDEEVRTIIKMIKNHKMIPAITLNPDTNIEKLFPFLDEVNNIMFMGGFPGKEKQEFMPSVYASMAKLRKRSKTVIIQVDIGVNLETAPKLAKAGCNYLNTGSFVGNAENPKAAIKSLEEAFAKGL